MAAIHLADLPKDGLSGTWGLCCAPKGYVTSDIFVNILEDLVSYLDSQHVLRPVILWIDGASPHLSLNMAEFCIANGIQPLLFKPNSTHLCQPLDLTFMSSLKASLKKRIGLWQHDNIGASLSKYSIVRLIREVTEQILQNKPDVIPNGFRRGGLCPWDPSAPDQAKMLPSKVFSPTPRARAEPEAASNVPKDGRRPDNPSIKPGLRDELHAVSSKGKTVISAPIKEADFSVEQEGDREELEMPLEEISVARGRDSVQRDAEVMGLDPALPVYTPRILKQFEINFFDDDQLAHCEELFAAGVRESSNPLYMAWLPLKKASLPSEEQALESVLQHHTPTSMPKRKKASGWEVPDGPSRFEPTSPEWQDIFQRQQSKATGAKKKAPAKQKPPAKKKAPAKQKPPAKKKAPAKQKATSKKSPTSKK